MGVRVVARRAGDGVCMNCYQNVVKGELHIVISRVTRRVKLEADKVTIIPGKCLSTIKNWSE